MADRFKSHVNWAQAKQEALCLTDRLGAKIDEPILDMVVLLQLLGLNTFSSCSGHAGRLTGGPYVMFESPESQKLGTEFAKLDHHSDGYRELRERAMQANLRERAKLLLLLDNFYRGRQVPFEERLIIEGLGREINRLKIQGIELMRIESQVKQRGRLLLAQDEMRAFTLFLKDRLENEAA